MLNTVTKNVTLTAVHRTKRVDTALWQIGIAVSAASEKA